MTKDERILIEAQFKSLASLFEVKLKASEEVICSRVTGLESQSLETKKVIDKHVEWHDTLNKSIVRDTLKGAVTVGIIVVVLIFILGVKEGLITTVLAKVIG